MLSQGCSRVHRRSASRSVAIIGSRPVKADAATHTTTTQTVWRATVRRIGGMVQHMLLLLLLQMVLLVHHYAAAATAAPGAAMLGV